ncbi:MAG: protein SCO1/2 [Myxococcota bacterium]|jgi:protein SCO1/2
MMVAVFATLSMVDVVPAQVGFETKEIKGVGVTEKLEAVLPLDLVFKDHNGVSAPLSSYFDGERPVVLTLNYANCPQLCKLQLDGFVSTLNELDEWQAGKQFQIITISLDPTESDEMAQKFHDRVLSDYTASTAESGWHFLRGSEQDIQAIADTIGYHYNFVERKGEYAHTAVITLLDPKAKVARYLYGIEYPSSTLRLSLAETANSKYVSTVDAFILRCFSFDANSGTFVANAWYLTKVIMTFVAVLLISFLVWLHRQKETKSTKPVA